MLEGLCCLRMSCLFFRNCLYFYQTYFQFLKILRGFSHPLVGRGAGAAHRSGGDRLSTPVFSGEPRDQHRGHLRAFGPTCNLKLSSCSLGGWRGPFTLKSLLQHSLLSSSLLFLLNLPGIWGRVIRCEGPGCSRGAEAAVCRPRPSGTPLQGRACRESSLAVAALGSVHGAQRSVALPQRDARQVNLRRLSLWEAGGQPWGQ